MTTISVDAIATIVEIVILIGVASIAVWNLVPRLRSRHLIDRSQSATQAAETRSGPVVSKYHPVLVVLHWFVAFAMAQLLLRGAFIMVHISNSDPAKIDALRARMFAGALVLTLMVTRLVLRKTTSVPPSATTGNPHLDRLKKIVLPLLYICVLCQASAGVGLALQTGLPRIVLGGHGGLPADF
jgi:cytochrome b561